MGTTLEEIERGDKVFRFWSEVLEDVLLVVPDGYKPRPEDPTCYTAREALFLLQAKNEEDMRTIHTVKKISRGRVIFAGMEPKPEEKKETP